MRNYNSLITDLDEWESHNGFKIGPNGWLAGMGSFNLAVAFSSLFHPEFIIHDDCIFIAPFTQQSEKNYRSFQEMSEHDKCKTEVTMNHMHIIDLFPGSDDTPTREQILYLGRTLKDMWQLKLDRDFPDRNFVVSFPEDHTDDLYEYEITFWQERDKPIKMANKAQ